MFIKRFCFYFGSYDGYGIYDVVIGFLMQIEWWDMGGVRVGGKFVEIDRFM